MKDTEVIKETATEFEENESKVDKDIKPVVIDLISFNKMVVEEQYKLIESTLKKIYDRSLNVRKKHVMKVISLTCNPENAVTYLPYGLRVDKNETELVFKFSKKKSTPLLLFLIGLFLLAILGATYAGINYVFLQRINIDIDGDEVADINIDINGDNIADINIDPNTNNITDGKYVPSINVDYKGNRIPTFNIDSDDDGLADKNLINTPINGVCVNTDKSLIYNCDTNGDGWPDVNLDVYNNKYLVLDIDTNGDNIPDLNIDRSGNRVCDLNCDSNDDYKCDTQCVDPETLDVRTYSGSTQVTGDPSQQVETPALVVIFDALNEISIDNMFPDDQPNMEQEYPELNFTIQNTTPLVVTYFIEMTTETNEFVLNNFQYSLTGDRGGANISWTNVPKVETYRFADNITINPGVTQSYSMLFRLRGTNQPQNEDQGKAFKAKINAKIITINGENNF